LCLELAPRVAQVAALDFSGEMVKHCKRRALELGVTNVEIVEGDGQNLPFAEARFDRAFSNFGLMFFPDRVAGFREMHRTLKAGGKVAVTSWQPAENSPGFLMLFGALVETGLVSSQEPSPIRGLDDAAVFRSELCEAGFQDVSVQPLSHDLVVTSVEELWDESVRGAVPIVLLKKKLADEWPAASEKVLEHLRKTVKPGQSFAMPAWLGTGTKGSAREN
jgi:ubiquinone/menaquinone biosynthesis C-methylase UbiE